MALVNLLQLFYKIFCLIVAIHKKYTKEIIIKNKSLTIMTVSSNQKNKKIKKDKGTKNNLIDEKNW